MSHNIYIFWNIAHILLTNGLRKVQLTVQTVLFSNHVQSADIMHALCNIVKQNLVALDSSANVAAVVFHRKQPEVLYGTLVLYTICQV